MGSVWSRVVARMKVKRLRQSIARTLTRWSSDFWEQLGGAGSDRLVFERGEMMALLVKRETGEEAVFIVNCTRSKRNM